MLILQIKLIYSLLIGQYSCDCFDSHILLKNINSEYSESAESVRHGKTTTLQFEKKGLVSIACIKVNSLPMMDTVENKVLKELHKDGIHILSGSMNNLPGYIWREDIINNDLSISYVIRKEYIDEFETIMNSIEVK